MSIFSDDDTNSTESDGEYDSARNSDVYMRMEDDVDAPDDVDLNGDVNIGRDDDDETEEDKEEEDEKEEEVVMEEDEEEEEDEDQDEDEDEDNGKEPWTIGPGEMVNTSADDVDTMVDDQPTVLPEQGHVMREHTSWPQCQVPAQRPQTLEPRLPLQTWETDSLIGLDLFGIVTPHKPCPAAPTLQEDETAGNTSDVDVEQQLLGELACGDSLPNAPLPHLPLPDVPVPDVPLHDVPLPNFPLPDVPLPEACPDGSRGEG